MTGFMLRGAAAAAVCIAGLGPASAQSAGDSEIGAIIYLSYCAACHGPAAKGDGEMGAILTVPPADLTALSAGNDGVFPTARVAWQIDGRDPLLAHGGEMPIFGEFFEGNDVAIPAETGQPMMTSQAIADLIAFLEAIQE